MYGFTLVNKLTYLLLTYLLTLGGHCSRWCKGVGTFCLDCACLGSSPGSGSNETGCYWIVHVSVLMKGAKVIQM